MTIREEVMAMAQEANLGRLLPASGTLPAQWYGNPIEALEKFAAFVITAERQRVVQQEKRIGIQQACDQLTGRNQFNGAKP